MASVSTSQPDARGGEYRVTVRVPATSANLGPGYDCFGLAMARYDEVTAHIIEGPSQVRVRGVGARTVPLDDRHLVLRAAARVFARSGESAPALALECVNRIPHGGGQGSSAAATVAGMMLARALGGPAAQALTDDDILALATEMEGHPDNVAPAIFGGLTVSWTPVERAVKTIRAQVHPTIELVVFSAQTHSSTKAARNMLPMNISHRDAAANSAATAVLLHALTVDPSYLMDGTVDLLHQSYRSSAMPASANLVARLRSAGVAAVISGAGPSVLALSTGALDLAPWDGVQGFTSDRLGVDAAGAIVKAATTGDEAGPAYSASSAIDPGKNDTP
ncbi:homoserine kinase [Nakamurella antarctica]|uniref:Homoserine kinase n=1 Tax=Nakamurella antarctica TaxID=1902245 RepID=A0A3G8ZMY6_9ACTN|nr:homoserine kinase [Nakamurella antarctica]AZI58167.1 homoserine kinase [Nakamurella antarctica]